jgi:hypothetical protein
VKSPKYNPTLGAGYDIALIKLKTAQQFELEQTGLSPICLPDWGDFKSKFTSDKECQIMENKTNHDVRVDFTNEDCSNSYQKRFDPTNMICVKVYEAKVNWCERNHGSPLMCCDSNDDKSRTDELWNTRLYLTGIASWPLTGAECHQKPDVFTKLYSNDYAKWINETIRPQQQLV